MKAKHIQIRQWLLFAVLVTIALYLHLRFPLESIVSQPDEQGLEASEPLSDAGQPASSASLMTMPSVQPRRDDHRAQDAKDGTHASTGDASHRMPVSPVEASGESIGSQMAGARETAGHAPRVLSPHGSPTYIRI